MPFPVTLSAYSAPGKKLLACVHSFNRDQPTWRFTRPFSHVGAICSTSNFAVSGPEEPPSSLSRIFPFSSPLSPLPAPPPRGPPTPRGPRRTAEMADSRLTLSGHNTDHEFRKRNVFPFQEVTTSLTQQMSTRLKNRNLAKMPFVTKGAQWPTFSPPANSVMVSQFGKII